jgi:hypothetical protein
VKHFAPLVANLVDVWCFTLRAFLPLRIERNRIGQRIFGQGFPRLNCLVTLWSEKGVVKSLGRFGVSFEVVRR